MKARKTLIGTVFSILAMSAAHAEDALVLIAVNYSKVADECLLDVRDRNVPYSRSINCTTRLKNASSAYIDTGAQLAYGFESKTIPNHAYISSTALSTAWSAAALSNAEYRNVPPVYSLW